MKELLANFLKEFLSCPIDQQLEIFQEIKSTFKSDLATKEELTEKSLNYIKNVYDSEFPVS